MLPKLSEVFGVTTDEILGLKQESLHIAEPVAAEESDDEPEGIHMAKGNFELQWDSGRRDGLGLALWVLLTGGLLLACPLWTAESIGLWDILWPSGLLIFGLFGLYPKFSVFRLGCGCFGGYYLLCNLRLIPPLLTRAYLLPLFLLLFGLSLLVDALRKPRDKSFTVTHKGDAIRQDDCTLENEAFRCTGSFVGTDHLIVLPRLRSGSADLRFGEMTIDLSGCEEIAENCLLDLRCSFGELELLVPRRFRVVPKSSTAFASVETKGSPISEPEALIHVNCSVNFGQITLRYL